MSGYQVLIVEDEAALRNIYHRILSTMGWEVLQAKDGEEAITFLQQTIPDLIFLDMRLPAVNGMEVLKFIRQNQSRLKQTHIVIASSSKDYERQIDSLPSAEFVLKPILPGQIRDIARRLMAHEH